MIEEKENVQKLTDEELEEVSGGGWGYHDINSEKQFNAVGIQTEWTNNPFVKDKFSWNGKSIDSSAACAIVFFVNSNGGRQPANITDALNYRNKNSDAYVKFCDNVNK